MNKRKKIIVGILISLLLVYILGAITFVFYTYPRTNLGTSDIGMFSIANLEKKLKNDIYDSPITITDQVVDDFSLSADDINLNVQTESLIGEIKQQQNPLLWPYQIFQTVTLDAPTYISVDEGNLNGKLISGGFFENADRTDPVDATYTFDKTKGEYVIKNEVVGTKLTDQFITDLTSAIVSGEESFDATAYYQQPQIVASDLQADVDLLNSRITRPITVTFGTDKVEVSPSAKETFVFLDDNGEIDVDNDALYNYLFSQAKKHNSAKITSTKRVVTSYDIENAYYRLETDLLDDSVTSSSVSAVENQYDQSLYQKSLPTSGTYIEVSISHQMMWLYNDGELVVQTPVITGNISLGRGTPVGNYNVWSKEEDKVLDGSTVGYDYAVPVQYWMAVDYTGVGIHDLSSLTSSNVKAKNQNNSLNGSHGCINTPSDVMQKVYENTPIGTPVYIVE